MNCEDVVSLIIIQELDVKTLFNLCKSVAVVVNQWLGWLTRGG